VGLEELLQPHDAVIVLVDNGESLPAPVSHDIHVSLRATENSFTSGLGDAIAAAYLGERIRVRIKIHQAAFASQPVVPAILQVGNLKTSVLFKGL